MRNFDFDHREEILIDLLISYFFKYILAKKFIPILIITNIYYCVITLCWNKVEH